MSELDYEAIEVPWSSNRIVVQANLGERPFNREAVVDNIRKSLQEQRGGILQMPSVESELRMDRVQGYCEKVGFPTKEIRVLDPVNYSKAQEITGRNANEDLEGGLYLPGLDIVIVKRDPEKEELNGGSEITESVLIHEIAHGSTYNPLTRIDVTHTRRFLRKITTGSSTNMRMGFVVENKTGEQEGYLLEEGYAELERGLYVAEILGKPGGFGEGIKPGQTMPLDKHTYLDREGNGSVYLNFPRGAIPAVILGLLIERDPELLSALRASRHSIEGGRDVARRIDAIRPGLYGEFRKADIAPGSSDVANLFKKVKNIA